MADNRELSALMERAIHKYIQYEKKPKCYGMGIYLTQSEVHTVAAIGDRPDISVTELALQRGVTKGAASQMVYKLVGKGYINKKNSPDSDAKVCLDLTEKGREIYNRHIEYHQKSGEKFFARLNALSEEQRALLTEILEEFDKMMSENIVSRG